MKKLKIDPRLWATSLVMLGASAFAQNKPYPQAVNFAGSIKPNNVTQATMNSQVSSYYTYWKGKYLKNNLASLPGGYYVLGDITGSADGYTPLGSSEGQGYGMIITALMAGYDANAQTIFDGLFKTARAYKSSANSNLMGWVVADALSAQGHFGSATDGDLDIAYALILAHYQWGSAGAVNYLAEAQKMITQGIKASNITTAGKVNLGDWQNNTTNDTRPSDWMIDHFRAYKAITGDATWDNVVNTTYSLINTIQTGYSPSTGLLPDFVTGNPAKPAAANFLESANDGNYYYNACRVPLRIVMDYGHYGTAAAKTAANKIITWAETSTSGNPLNFKAGYTLGGTALSGSGYQSAVFIAPTVAAATCDASHQNYLNTGWNAIVNMKAGYFEDSYNLLCMLYISGNWWKADGTVTPPSNQLPVVSITSPSNNATFTAPANVSIAVNATDADGTISNVQFYNGATLLGSDNTAPYTFAWNSVAAGTYAITAKATDNASGASTSSVINIVVNSAGNTAPTVTLTSPTNNAVYTVGTTVPLKATASDVGGSIAKVEFYRGTTLIASDATSPYSFNWTNAAAGSYAITAKAYDNLGLSTTSTIANITVNAVSNTAPTVSLTSPTNNAAFTAPASVSISANASDNVSVSKVEFYQGTTLLFSDATAPYSYTWSNVAAGSYSITAKAFDNVGLTTTSTAVNITVNAASGGSCATLPQYAAGTAYAQDQKVKNINNQYRCLVPGWCSSTSAFYYEPGVGLAWADAWALEGACTTSKTDNQGSGLQLSVYPNPFNEQLNLVFDAEKASYVKVDVYNSLGQMVYSAYQRIELGNYTVPLSTSDWASGLYIINASSTSFNKQYQVIK